MRSRPMNLCRSFMTLAPVLMTILVLICCPLHAQELVIESWRKDDQLFWEKVLIPAFRRLHPDIKVRFNGEEPLGYDNRIESKLATHRAGDLIFCRPFDQGARLHEKGHLLPLHQDHLTHFSTQARRPWTTEDGKTTYCLPVAYVIHGLFYNRQIFRKLQLQPPRTTEELMQTLKKVAASATVTPLALGTSDMWESNQVIFTGMGPNYWNGEKGRQALLAKQKKFTDPEFIRVWKMMAQLKPYMHEQQQGMSNSDIQLLFATGNAAIYPSGSWDIDFLRNTSMAHKKPIELGAFKPPLENSQDTCHISVHPDFGIGINKHSTHLAGAVKFIEWLGSAEFSQLLTDTLSGYFSLSDHTVRVDDPVAKEMLSWRQECKDTIRLNSEKLNRVWPPLEEELWYVNVKVINHEMTPEEAAQHIQNVHEKNAYLR